jgi:cytoskeletal protein CcmA (bactofilin family)
MQFMKGKQKDEIVSHLGEGAEFAGELAFDSGMHVKGVIKGKVQSEGTLEIGPGGKIDAEVLVRRIVIGGEFRGVIRASERVEILKDGKVYGDIFTPCLIIEAGAAFDGRCNMSDKKAFMKEEGNPLKAADSESNRPAQIPTKP